MDSTDGHRSRRNAFMPEVLAQPAIPHGFTLDLTAWKLGIPANQDQAIAWAHAHGFQSVGAHTQEIARWKEADFETYAQRLDEAKLTWSIASMPVAFRGDESAFKESLATLPAAARALEKAGIERCITTSCHATTRLPTAPISDSTNNAFVPS